MKRRLFLAAALLCISVLLSFISFNGLAQGKRPPHPKRTIYYRLDSLSFRKPWSRNILFKPGASKADITKAIDVLKGYLQRSFDKVRKEYPGLYRHNLVFHVDFCPCDPLLYTLNADVILQGSGEVASQPPSSPGGPKGGGDKVNTIAYNYAVTDVDTNLNKNKEIAGLSYALSLPADPAVDASNILAIMDTGLDPSRFPPGINKLIWRDTKKTLFNFLPGKPTGTFMDDHEDRHGSAVTGMALGQIKNDKRIYPTLMIMKVLDSKKTGSSFSVSCALSYAFQHHARVINMSLGYYTDESADSVLNYYISQCVHSSPKPIAIFAAAGNDTSSHHDPNMLCGGPNTNNLLSPNRLFFPACLRIAYPQLISVTGLTDNLKSACFYQNYSPIYVTVGLVKKEGTPTLCCKYLFPYKRLFYEGTSFATPIVSGMVMNELIAGLTGTSPLSALGSLIQTASSLNGKVTLNNNFIPY